MNAPWTELVAAMLRPARPRLSVCRTRASSHLVEQRRADERRAQALADCVMRIENARASVFAAGDGIVKADMTALEREWRTLARAERSCEERALALWGAIAPAHWAGRLRWTPSGDADADVETAVALASDPEGVARAEACALRLVSLLATWGIDVAPTVAWHVAPAPPIARAAALFERPLHELTETFASTYGGDALLARAAAREQAVLAAASQSEVLAGARELAEDVALVARIDLLWRARATESRGADAESPTGALVELWSTGYVLSAVDHGGVTLGAVVA